MFCVIFYEVIEELCVQLKAHNECITNYHSAYVYFTLKV